jgi:hypothetical protein
MLNLCGLINNWEGDIWMDVALPLAPHSSFLIPYSLICATKGWYVNFLTSGYETQKRFPEQQQNAQKYFVRFEVLNKGGLMGGIFSFKGEK